MSAGVPLRWAELADGTQLAGGSGCVYVVASDTTVGVILTRYAEHGLGRIADTVDAAVQAARNAVRLGRQDSPEMTAAHITRAKRLAQEFEDGENLIGQPRWQQVISS